MSDLDEIKSRVNIVDFIGTRVKLKKAGRNYKGLCPFHGEKTPSFMVNPDRQTWHCFGCGKGGSVFDFVMESEHVDFAEALETLAEKVGVTLERHAAQTQEAKVKENIRAVNHLAGEYYHYLLTKHALGATAREYLKSRQISDKSVDTFKLGYSPNSWDGLYKFLTKKGYQPELLVTAGLVIASTNSHYDRFRGRLMFALKDHRGNVVGFSGRVLDPEAKEAKYINTSETPLYQKSQLLYGLDVTKAAIQKENEAVIMEGEIDVISSFQAGVSNVVAIKGSAVTEGHIRLLRRFTERLVFALDSDLAGDAAVRRGITLAESAGMELKVMQVPFGKDPDEVARENPVLLKKAVKSAVPIYDYFLDSAGRRFDLTAAFGKKKAADELLPVLARIENSIVQGHYLKKLAEVLGVSEVLVQDGVRRVQRGFNTSHNIGKVVEKAVNTGVNREEKVLRYCLSLLLQGSTRDFFEDFAEQIPVAHLSNNSIRQILTSLGQFLQDNPTFFVRDFVDQLPSELTPVADEALLWDLSEFVEDENRLAAEWQQVLFELKRLIFRRKINETTAAIAQADEAVPEGRQLRENLTDLMRQLKALESSH